jgi:hypothetical protein
MISWAGDASSRGGMGMNDAKWERWAAATGIAAFVLLAVSNFFVTASPPKITDSA